MNKNILKNIFRYRVCASFVKHKFVSILTVIITIVLCVLVFLFTDKANNRDDLVDEIQEISDKNEYIEKPDRTQKFKEAFEKNNDTVGWIYIPGTTIDSPIMKGIDNNYYLRRNEEKEYAFEGCIFGDYYSVFSPFENLSNNIVIHGHNLDDNPEGKRFAQLVKFQNIKFAESTPYIFLTTEDASLVYEIYAVFFTDIKFGYTCVGLGEKMQQSMIDEAKQRSEYIYDVDVSGKDKIITLSTCTYKYGAYGSVGQENTRFSIQGKLLKNADKLYDKIKLKKNLNPKLPKIN